MKNLTKTAKEAAVNAGEYIVKNIGKIRKISFKGATNLVTNIDKTSEELIVSRLRKAFPDFSVLAEEAHDIKRDGPFRWIIDPLDGTTNYVHGFPFFSVSIALEKEGEGIILGVVYDPVRQELFCAEKKKGAYLNNKRIRVSKIRRIRQSLVATGFTYDSNVIKQKNMEHFSDFLVTAQAIRRAGSAALDLCGVACGRLDGFWELDLNPWDVAAGALIVGEAGGLVTRFDNTDATIYDKEILATNRHIHNAMSNTLLRGAG